MWYDVFKFELRYRLKRADTYVFFIFLFFFSIIGVDFVFQGVDFGFAKKNAPLVIAKTMGVITGLFMILASMIMGVPVLRDFQYQIAPLLFTTSMKKKDYFIGRFIGSFFVLVLVFSSVFLGLIASEFMPWHGADAFLPFNIFTYLKPFLFIVLPILFFGAALFFITGALTKKLVVVYTQGIFLFVVFILTKAITNETLQAILDPFSLTTLTLVANDWTLAEKSIQSFPLFGVILYNKLFWIVLGSMMLIYGYRKFSFSVAKEKKTKKNKSLIFSANPSFEGDSIEIPKVKMHFDLKSKWMQLRKLSWFYFLSVSKQSSFWAIVICGMIIILINSVNLGTVYGVDSYPATYLIVEELQETSIYFFIIILVFYSGELIWKERDSKLNLIHDATSVSGFVNLIGKYIGLNMIYMILMIALIISGIMFQTLSGYYTYELPVYFYGFFLEVYPFLALFTCIAFFIQALVNHKFIGIMLTIVFFITSAILVYLGFDHDLYFFGGSSLGSYSDMNGYGHFLKPYLVIKLYWALFSILLLTLAALILVRGNEINFIKRLKISKQKLSVPLFKFIGLVALLFVGIGSFIFYNTNILNEYWTPNQAIAYRVDYEKELKQFEHLPQPKLVDVNLKLELYPAKRNYTVNGYYILKNTTDAAITSIHIQKQIENNVFLEDISFGEPVTLDTQYKKFDYFIYNLNKPLQPDDSIKMYFKQRFVTKGFELGNSNTNINNNGTFFRNTDLPTLGYNRKYELRDANDREDYNLPVRFDKADQNNINELKNARSGGDSDGINFEMIVGTSKDQTALVPGNLMKQWKANNRNYFHYKMEIPMVNFYSIVSARYEIKKDQWVYKKDSITKAVDLEIYYHKDHDYNLDRMMNAMKASLSYYSKNFSPYQYEQLRIMEFPRFANFAQSFPGTIPFSESIGFILDIDDEKDVDMAFYVTAHEVAHQWFGMQVEAANVKGKNFILETLSQYAAMMVLKSKFSEEKVAAFIALQKDAYKEGKAQEFNQEPSLAQVENQDYVYYAKGAMNMYEFQKSVGEQAINNALRRFISDWNTIDGTLKKQKQRYATSKDLLNYFKAITPKHLEHIIPELFEATTDYKSDQE